MNIRNRIDGKIVAGVPKNPASLIAGSLR